MSPIYRRRLALTNNRSSQRCPDSEGSSEPFLYISFTTGAKVAVHGSPHRHAIKATEHSRNRNVNILKWTARYHGTVLNNTPVPTTTATKIDKLRVAFALDSAYPLAILASNSLGVLPFGKGTFGTGLSRKRHNGSLQCMSTLASQSQDRSDTRDSPVVLNFPLEVSSALLVESPLQACVMLQVA